MSIQNMTKFDMQIAYSQPPLQTISRGGFMIVKLKIKEAREKSGLSLNYLAEETGIDRRRLQDLENNKIETEKILFIEMLVIADTLKTKITDLYEKGEIEIIKKIP